MQEESRIQQKLSALEALGLERLDVSPVSTEATLVGRDIHKIYCTKPAMGTLVALTALGSSKDQVEDAIGTAFEEMDRLIALLTCYESSSAVGCLNSYGRLENVPRELNRLLSRSLYLCELSGEAFDISVEPLVHLFRDSLGGSAAREPTRAEVKETLELVGSRHIKIESGRVCFDRTGMEISLNGIAKGYIVDAMARVMDAHNICDYLINAGGDIRTAGAKENQDPWTVAVQDPSKSGDFPDILTLTNAAVATSGGYEKSFDCSGSFHHIFDSRNGMSPGLNASVTVVAPSAWAADALATTVFVLDPIVGIRFVEALRACECLVVGRNGQTRRSNGWRSTVPTTKHEVDL